jgi:hypothetical protein
MELREHTPARIIIEVTHVKQKLVGLDQGESHG